MKRTPTEPKTSCF